MRSVDFLGRNNKIHRIESGFANQEWMIRGDVFRRWPPFRIMQFTLAFDNDVSSFNEIHGRVPLPNILIVDDSEMDRLRVKSFLAAHRSDLTTRFANDGIEAIAAIEQDMPDLIVTDLLMPNMNGLELVSRVKDCCPLIPIILMTSQGSEEIASEALEKGAVSYVPKSVLKEYLPSTIDRTLEVSFRDRRHSRLMHALDHSETTFQIQNDPDLIELATNFYQEMLRCMPLGNEGNRLRVGNAIKHALWHVWYFGNLEIEPAIDDDKEFRRLVQERSEALPYCSRSMVVSARITPRSSEFRISHEGQPLQLPESHSGNGLSAAPFTRGLVLISRMMDTFQIEEGGHALVMSKQSEAGDELVIFN